MITIYGLHTPNGVYIGCTAGKLNKRMREHRCLLNSGAHKVRLLQEAWDENPLSFEMVAIETLPEFSTVVEKRECELKWMKFYDSMGLLLNDHKISFSPPIGAPKLAAAKRVANGFKHSEESNLKRGLAQKGKPKGHGAKISATKQANKLLMR